MGKERFKEVRDDDDGIIIYDESDDYVPGEATLVDDDDPELDIAYLERAWKRQQEEAEKEKRTQRWVSVGVIVGVIAIIVAICFWKINTLYE